MLIKDIIISQKASSKNAVIYKNTSYTYKDLYKDCNIVSENAPKSSGNIGIFLPNSYEFVVAFFSTSFMQKIVAPISVNSSKLELISIIKYCDISLIITNFKYYKMILSLIETADIKIDFYLIDTNESISLNNYEKCNEDTNDNSIFLLVHTSGSLNNPKRVALSHRNLITNSNSIIQSLSLNKDDISVIVMPLYLISAITSQMITHLLLGATIVILELPFMANDFHYICNKYNATNLTCVPTTLNLLTLRNPVLSRLPSLKKICFGGAPTPKQRIYELIDNFPNIEFVHMYGQTEASARLTHLLGQDFSNHVGSVGKPIPNVEMMITDQNGDKCDPLTVGEVSAKGDNIMVGYYKDVSATKDTVIDRWLKTGDLGYVDIDGYYYIVGRKKNVIISGGVNIYPEEIEEILLTHANVIDALAFGEEDILLGEVVCAKVVLKEKIPEERLADYCSSLMSHNKVPRKFIICDNIDKTSTGKLRRI